VIAAAPTSVLTDDGRTLYRGSIEWSLLAESLDASTGTYELTLSYAAASKNQSDVGTIRFNYDTTGATAHITQALAEVDVYRADTGSAAPDFGGVIGLKDDDVEGTDVPVPIFNLTVTKVFSPADLPNPNDVFDLTGCTNLLDFIVTDSLTGETIVFQAKEMIFLGARRSDPRADGNVEVTFTFTASPNVVNQTVGDITGISKDGSQYAWSYLARSTDGVGPNKTLVLQAQFVIIDKVVPDGDYGVLNI
jgi:hypothetical protein